MDTERIKTLLASGDFEQFKGAIEIQAMECKSVPYRLEETYQKQELAKDISGMANATGGFILLGLVTAIDPVRAEEKITEIRPFASSLFDPQQYRDTLKTWVYPALENIEVNWWPCADDVTKGIAAICILPQPAEKQPFLVTRTVTESGRASEIVFGHFERRRTNVDATSVARLHSLLQGGMQSHQVIPQLQSMQHVLEQLVARAEAAPQPSPPPNPVSEQDTVERVNQAVKAVELEEQPSFALSARPLEATTMPTLFRSRQEELVKLMEDPLRFREAGFHIKSRSAQTQIVEGNRRASVYAKSQLVELWRDGTLIVVVRGDEGHLCWGSKAGFVTINPAALIETVHEFVELSRGVYLHAEPQPNNVEYTIHLQKMDQQGVLPRLGTFAHWGLTQIGNPAPGPDMISTLPANVKDESVGEIVFKIVATVYEWYGVEHDRIPLRRTNPGTQEKLDDIDIQQLINMR